MPILRVDTTPTLPMLLACWEVIVQDVDRSLYLSDSAFVPAKSFWLNHFLRTAGLTIFPCIAFMHDEMAAFFWLKDTGIDYAHERPLVATMEAYLFPAWRHRAISPECAAVLCEGLASYDVPSIRSFIRPENAPLRAALHACGFALVASLPSWQCYEGAWQTNDVYVKSFGRAGESPCVT